MPKILNEAAMSQGIRGPLSITVPGWIYFKVNQFPVSSMVLAILAQKAVSPSRMGVELIFQVKRIRDKRISKRILCRSLIFISSL